MGVDHRVDRVDIAVGRGLEKLCARAEPAGGENGDFQAHIGAFDIGLDLFNQLITEMFDRHDPRQF